MKDGAMAIKNVLWHLQEMGHYIENMVFDILFQLLTSDFRVSLTVMQVVDVRTSDVAHEYCGQLPNCIMGHTCKLSTNGYGRDVYRVLDLSVGCSRSDSVNTNK
jgi:hypothetical protein